MWVKRTSEKFSLLTVANITYTGDPRIKITFQYPNNWRLHIDPLTKEDAGLYMCQVSTHPPKVFATQINVLRERNSIYAFTVISLQRPIFRGRGKQRENVAFSIDSRRQNRLESCTSKALSS